MTNQTEKVEGPYNNTENSSANAPQASEVAKEGAEARVATTMASVARAGKGFTDHVPLIYHDSLVTDMWLAGRAEAVGFHAYEAFDTFAFHALMPCHDGMPKDLGFINIFGVKTATREASTDGKRTDATEGDKPDPEPTEPTALTLLEELVGAMGVIEDVVAGDYDELPTPEVNKFYDREKDAYLAAKSFLSERGKGA